MKDTQPREDAIVEKVIGKHNQLKAERVEWEDDWRNILSVTFPERDPLFTAGQKGRADRKMFDNTPTQSSILLASALHSRLTNPAIQWFGFTTGDPELDKNDRVKKHLEEVEYISHSVFNDSNFHTEMASFYIDLVTPSTAILGVEEDKEDVLRFKSTPVWNHWIDVDHKGQVDTIHTEYEYSARQLVQKYGVESFTDEELRELEDDTKKYIVIHSQCPRDERNKKKKDKKNKPYASYEIIKDFKKLVREGGYDRLKMVVGRFSVLSTEKYGRGPGHYSLADCLMLQEMQKVVIRASQKAAAPPMLLPDDGVMMPFKSVPDAINYYRAGMTDPITYMEPKGNIRVSLEMIERTADKIKKAFYADQLQLIENRPQMTATEVDIRNQDNMSLLSPTLARQHYDVLKKLVEITYPIMEARGLFPDPPDELVDRNIKPFYTSQIARAQKGSLLNNLRSLYGIIEPLAALDPEIRDAVDTYGTLKYGAEVLDLPTRLFKSEEDYNKIKKQKAQMLQKQMQMQEQQMQAQTANTASQAMSNMPQTEVPEGEE
jgi:hypothetical protein